MYRLIRAAILFLVLPFSGGVQADEAWFRLGFGSGLTARGTAPPAADTNSNIEIGVDTLRGRAYGDLSLPVVVSGIDASYAVEVVSLPSGAIWATDPGGYGSGTIEWPNASAGVHHLTIEVHDGEGVLVASQAIEISVYPPLTASVPQSSYVFEVGDDAPQIQASAQNAIGDVLWASDTVALPPWLDLNAETGAIEVDTRATNELSSIALTAVDQADLATASTYPFDVRVSESCDVWTPRTAAGVGTWNAATYGNGKFVVVAINGDAAMRVMTSTNGTDWTLGTVPEETGWTSVAYGKGKFVAVGPSRAMTSSDGISWDARAAAPGGWQSVTYGNGLFVAVAQTGPHRVMTSPDGITWTARPAADDIAWYAVTHGNGMFVAVAGDSNPDYQVMTSPDGITWTPRTGIQNVWHSVVYGNGRFVAVGSGASRVMTSPDGLNWTARTAAAPSTWHSVTYGNGLFVAVAFSGTARVMTSSDGVAWTARTAAESNKWYSVVHGNGMFVAAAWNGTHQVMTSSCHNLTVPLANHNGHKEECPNSRRKAVPQGERLVD